MNITHAVNEEVNGDRLGAIFERQKELMGKYHIIESRSGLCQTEDCPINLDDKRGQARIKDFSWRVMEEVGEAIDGKDDTDHYQEELIDGLHFLTELTILTGKDHTNLVEDQKLIHGDYMDLLYEIAYREVYKAHVNGISIEEAVYNLVKELGMTCNCLKNKPWKQSHMKTDQPAFYSHLERTWVAYFSILIVAGLDKDSIVNTYLKKSQVNKFRQRSNY